MTRPYVKINKENKIDDLLKSLEMNIGKFKSLDGVKGIILDGGLSRGYGDHLSEIDIVIYLDKEHYEKWQKEKSPIPLGIIKFDGFLYDIKIVDLQNEKERSWDNVALWDLSYSKILFDPEEEIAGLMKDKLSDLPKPLEAEGLLFSSWWYFRLAGDIWIHREDALQGHFMLNKAIIPLIEALFIANKEYVPHEKWIIHMSRTLQWKPEQWEQRLSDAMSTGDLSIESLINRQSVIEELWNEIDTHIKSNECLDFKLSIMQKTFYDLFKLLIDRGVVTVKEWKEKASLSMLNGDPFYNVVTVDDEKIVLNKEILLSIKPDDMYYWHYEVLNKVVNERKCYKK